MAQPAALTDQQKAQIAQQNNIAARNLVLQQSQNMTQQIYSTTFTTGPGTVLNIPVKQVGLIKRFWVEITATVTNPSGPTQTLTTFGPSNLLSNVLLTDLSNQQRINTAGWHLSMVSSVKRRLAFGAAVTSDTPLGFGNNFKTVIQAPATIASSTAGTVNMYYEVPVSYTDADLRGAIYAGVTSATMYLQLTFSQNMFAATGTDATFAMYQSSSSTLPTLTSVTVTVYQNYLDQLPIGKNGFILPLIDMSSAYLLNNTPISALTANQDIPIPYANFRDFLSTTVIYDNNGTLNTGSDIAYWALSTANYTNIFKYDANTSSLLTRLRIMDDMPKGTYYFDHRHKPINTIQYGNMALIANLSNVGGAGSALYLGYEAIALINQITQAGSLYGT